MKIRSNAEQVLKEHFNELDDDAMTLREYIECESLLDPDFFRWFFDDNDIEDFGSDMTNEHRNLYKDFLNNL